MKKVLISLIIMVMVLVVVGRVEARGFRDVGERHQNREAIMYLQEEGVVEGYGDESFRPSGLVNRAEFLKVLLEESGYNVSEQEGGCFPDVDEEWFAPYVCKAKDLGIIDGYPDGNFKPEKPVNFVEASKMIAEMFGVPAGRGGSHWFDIYVMGLEEKEAIPPEVISFAQLMTRGQVAEMIWRVSTNQRNRRSNTYRNIEEGKMAPEGEGEEEEEEEEEEEAPSKEMEQAGTCDALAEILAKEKEEVDYSRGDLLFEEDFADDEAEFAPAKSAVNEATGADAGSVDYSETNVQVEGVDEADIVKTDGEYIYLVKNNSVRVVEAYPPENLDEVEPIEFGDNSFRPIEMFLADGKLTVIGSSYGGYYMDEPMWEDVEGGEIEEAEMILPDWRGNTTQIFVFDVSNVEEIELERSVAVEGNYISSRRIGGEVYVATSMYGYYGPVYRDDLEEGVSAKSLGLPRFWDSAVGEEEVVCDCGNVYYPPYMPPRGYTTLMRVSVDDLDEEVERTTILGEGGVVYVSKENFYLVTNYYARRWGENYNETIVHKFKLDEDLTYVGQGEVPGTVLNQFSLDEYDGKLRVATTVQSWESGVRNNVYVLNEDLAVIGRLENLAPGEKIYSARFMGERAYLVTFVRIDPLFVIDLSDPENPSVLGELKIPGVSDYLHPWDETHLIGFGVDASTEDEVEQEGWVWFEGLKIAMFDVSDVDNPKELHKVVIGDRGSDTPLRRNHKALLIDKERGLMALPVRVAEIPEELKQSEDTPAWQNGEVVFQGAYVYDVSVENGFDLRGKISHFSENTLEEMGGNYWGGPRDIERIVRIGEYLYSISQEVLASWDIDDLEELSRVDLKLLP